MSTAPSKPKSSSLVHSDNSMEMLEYAAVEEAEAKEVKVDLDDILRKSTRLYQGNKSSEIECVMCN